jgi:ABC-type multidrug transport system fused ATPase/permease subunit
MTLDLADSRAPQTAPLRDPNAPVRDIWHAFGPGVSISRLAGGKNTAIFFATIPTGLALGAMEIALAFIFILVLIRFHLLSGAVPNWLPNELNPIALLGAATVVAAALRYLSQILPNIAQLAFEARVRQLIVDAALDRPDEGTAFSVAEASHLGATVAGRAGAFLLGTAQSIGIAGAFVLIASQLFYLSWELAAFSLAGALVLGSPALYLRSIYGRFSDRQYLIYQSYVLRFLKDVRNAHFLKVCGLHRSEAAKLKSMVQASFDCSRNYQLLSAISSNFPSLAGVLLIVSLLWMNERYDLMPATGLVPFVYLLNRAVGSLVTLSSTTAVLRDCLPYVFELSKHVDTLLPKHDTARQGESAAPTPRLSALELTNLEFGRCAPLTPPLSVAVRSGEVALITGSSGRGKTTLLMTLLGLIPPLRGRVSWSGTALGAIDPSDLRRKIGFAGPEPYLIDADIRTNLLFGLERSDVTETEIDQALHVACADFVYELEDGLGHQLRENGDGISAGQKQRLAVARCLLRRPEALVFDEATANIDEDTEQLLFDRLLAAYPEMLIIVVSHRSSLRKFATKVVDVG